MKILNLYNKQVYVKYKHSICSFAAFFVLIVTIFAVIVPFYIAFYVYHDWWSKHNTIYEQPMVKYQHKYIFMAEHGDTVLGMGTKLVACNSFKYLNELLTDYLDCTTIKFWEKDSNSDQIADQMHFEFIFRPPDGNALNNLNIYLEFDSHMNTKCNLPIPSALLIQQEPVPSNFVAGKITIEGRLDLHQSGTFHCPFFLRKYKSRFSRNLVPENSTDIRDFNFNVIREQIVNRNPGYLLFEKTNVYWNRHQQNTIIVNIVIHIGELQSLYHTSFWQKLGRLWIQYLSIFVVFWYIIDKLKYYMFTRQKIKAWELVPWKKMY